MSEANFSDALKRMNAVVDARIRLLSRLALLAGEELDAEAKTWIEGIASTTGTVCREQAERWFRKWLERELSSTQIGGLRVTELDGHYYALPFPGLCLQRAANRIQAFMLEQFQDTASVLVRPYCYEKTKEIGIAVEVFTGDRATCLADALLVQEET